MSRSVEINVAPAGSRLPSGGLLAARAVGGDVGADFTDGVVILQGDWLRDNCGCDVCRIRQTDERRYRPWIAGEAVRPGHVSVDAGALTVLWSDGHVSIFETDAWKAIDVATKRGSYEAHLWTGTDRLATIDHGAVVSDLTERLRLFEAIRRDGAALVTGAPRIPGTVIGFARSIGITLLDSSLGFIFDVALDPAGFNVAYTNEELPPHNDNAQYANRPSGQILSMVVNDATGGESIVVDGWRVLHELEARDPEAVEVLSRVEVAFRQYSDAADGFTRVPLVRRDAAGRFSHLRFSNQLMQPLPFDHPELRAWYRAYRALGRVITDPANQIRFRLNGGDMLIVSGERVLHARTAFQPDGPRHLQDVYFNMDDVFSGIARLTGEARNAMVRG